MSAPTNKTICRALAAHEALRRVGVPAKDIYVQPLAGKLLVVGRPKYGEDILLGAGDLPEGDWLEAWKAAVGWWNDPTTPVTELEVLWQAHKAEIDAVELFLRLGARKPR